jgi:hypothetical protein
MGPERVHTAGPWLKVLHHAEPETLLRSRSLGSCGRHPR